MSWTTLFITAFIAALLFRWLKPASAERQEQFIQKLQDDMPIWVGVLNSENQVWSAGRRVTWLPSVGWGQGACLMIGAINLAHAAPDLRASIEQKCHPVYLDDNLVLAHILARPGQQEDLMLGPLDDAVLQNKIETAIGKSTNEIDVFVEVTSGSIGLADTEESRRAFQDVWQQYASAETVPSIAKQEA